MKNGKAPTREQKKIMKAHGCCDCTEGLLQDKISYE